MTNPMPKHIALIMDGNGRWAKSRGLPRIEGHRRGADAMKAMISAGKEMGLENMTFYTFSSENWKRSEEEVSGLMSLLRRFVKSELDVMKKQGVRLRIFGDKRPSGNIPADILQILLEAEEETLNNTSMNVNLCFNYGGRDEIVRAAQLFADDVEAGRRYVGDLDEGFFAKYLDSSGLPDPEIMIRTGGDMRISNFLLWQLAYAELFFIEDFWPDFKPEHLQEVVDSYMGIERRFGGRLEES